MNVIVVSNRLSKAITLGSAHLAALGAVLVLSVIGLVTAASWATYTLIRPLGLALPRMATLPLTPAAQQQQIDLLAVRLGELQAQMVKLDGLARRVSEKAGIDATPYRSDGPAPQGGARTTLSERAFSLTELEAAIAQTQHAIDEKLDLLGLTETILAERQQHAWQLPTSLPTPNGVRSSLFGWRIDPFNGRQSFHEGIDFLGDIGTPIYAAAAGRVVKAEYHSEYGNIVEIDHGKGLTSRYAHASRLLVQEGATVDVGQRIALLGNTGRSTGPHLHFEIRYKGVPQNPLYFLAGTGSQMAAR
jgi:murein DD-endopeptidase MepM/ murein hydrolase activator NlpD